MNRVTEERNRKVKLANLSPNVSIIILNVSDLRLWAFPGGASGEDPPASRRLEGCRFDPWARKIPQRRRVAACT